MYLIKVALYFIESRIANQPYVLFARWGPRLAFLVSLAQFLDLLNKPGVPSCQHGSLLAQCFDHPGPSDVLSCISNYWKKVNEISQGDDEDDILRFLTLLSAGYSS